MSENKDVKDPELASAGEAAGSPKEQSASLKRVRSTGDGNDGKEVEDPVEESDGNVASKKAKIVKGAEKGEKTEEKEDITANKDSEPKKEKPIEDTKHVFGSSTAFGGGFGMAKKTGNAASAKNQGKVEERSSPKPFAFGSGLSFGGGFSVLKKSDETTPEAKAAVKDSNGHGETPVLDDKREKTTEAETTPSSADNSGVKLQKQEVKSGEEAEQTIYQVNAKLYQLSALKDGWKERGVGVIKVNKDKSTGKARLVMRSRGILKVILNLPLIKGFKIQQGFPGSLQGEKFIRITTVDDNKSPLQYAVKTGKEETVQELYEKIVDLVPK